MRKPQREKDRVRESPMRQGRAGEGTPVAAGLAATEEHRATARRLLGEGHGGRRARAAGAVLAVLRDRRGAIGAGLLTAFALIAALAPWLAPQDPRAAGSFSSAILADPSAAHWLGTDENGRDLLSQLLLGTQDTMLVGFTAALVSSVIGTAVGIAAGYFGGWTDRILSILNDWFLVLPMIPVTVLAASLLGNRAAHLPLGRTTVLIMVIGLFGWAGTSRIVRAEVLSLKHRAFVERSVVLGAGRLRVIRTQILPNVAPLVLANAVVYVALAVLTESTLSYLGLGDPDRFSWGGMLQSAQESGAMSTGAWGYFLAPGLGITLVVLGFSLLGHAIESRVDPRLREQR
ncbi:ABC transporter permease [Streptomyces sp. NBC_01433]|uniref:ABC transporter permease n=1 Tax=Streptomyces sp. NBC_01433 TaxID=2903864 RepID=UPI00225452E1|nr:ABC transporter permease [Streptomyces sp. NBC_01433]MCX4679004.1 ABC transporter permease [Streptomyces sp. NBC_01433]